MANSGVAVGWKLPASAEAESPVRLESSKRVLIEGFELSGTANIFARIEGSDSVEIRLTTNKLGSTRKALELGDDVKAAIQDQSKF